MQSAPLAQYNVNEQVWLKAKHLTLPYQTTKLTPKCHGPFRILKQVSPVAYKLELPPAWTIHPVFHASLLTPYHETIEHGANYQWPPPKMIEDQEEYEEEQVISHQYYGCKKALQYLICWKGYSVADNTWEPADQVFTDALVKAYHRKHPLDERKAPTFTTHLQAALAKSHWHPHNPLTNFEATGPVTKQDWTGAPKVSAPMVLTASGTEKNTSTSTPCAVAQPIKSTAKADALERSASRKYIHKALVKFFTCQPHIPLPSPTVPITGQITVVHCNAPLNASKLLATMTATSIHRQSASMARNASLSWKAFPTFIPVSAALLKLLTTPGTKTGHSPQLWRTLSGMPSSWSRPLPSSVTVWLPAKQEGDVTVQLACTPENCKDMYRNPMMGSGRLPEGGLEGVGPRMEAGEPLEGRLISNNEVSMTHGCSKTGFRLPGPLAHTSPEHVMWKGVFSSRSSSMEPGCFSKPDDSAWLTVSQRWWVRAWEASLVSLSKFISASVSRPIMVTALWAVLLSFHLCLCSSYYCTITRICLCMYIYHILHIMQYTSARNSKSSLLSAGGIFY